MNNEIPEEGLRTIIQNKFAVLLPPPENIVHCMHFEKIAPYVYLVRCVYMTMYSFDILVHAAGNCVHINIDDTEKEWLFERMRQYRDAQLRQYISQRGR